MWLLQWVIVFKSKSDGVQWLYSWWKIWSVVREHKVFCLVSESRALTYSGFPASILSHSDRVFPKEVLELHVTLTTLKTEVVKSFDGIFTAGQLDRVKCIEEDIEISGVWADKEVM